MDFFLSHCFAGLNALSLGKTRFTVDVPPAALHIIEQLCKLGVKQGGDSGMGLCILDSKSITGITSPSGFLD